MTDTPETVEQDRLDAEGREPAAPQGAAGPAGRQAEPGAEPTGEPVAGAPYETPEQTAERVKELTSDLQRLQAEYLNYKRRVDRDRELVVQNAKVTILTALLPVLDDVDRAREHGELTGGFKAVAERLQGVVAGQGLERFGAPGDAFDPRFHEALAHRLSADVATTSCDNVVQAGYRIGDRVVRAAMVTVVEPDPSATAAEPAAAAGPDGGAGAPDA